MLVFLLTFIDNEDDRQRLAAIFNSIMCRWRRSQCAFGGAKDAEDAVQNAFIQIIKHFEKAKGIPCEEMLFWLISIVKNEALMILRKNKRAVPLEGWKARYRIWNRKKSWIIKPWWSFLRRCPIHIAPC